MSFRTLVFLSILYALVACGGGSESEPNPTPSPPSGGNNEPPFGGTIFVNSDIITESDPTTFVSLTSLGIEPRLMFDRRENRFITVDVFLFNALYDNSNSVEVQVNIEFETESQAQQEALFYATEIGRLPEILRKDLETVWIHKGVELFGGGNNNILIHTGQTPNYIADNILEEVLIHEAAHTSLDAEHAQSTGWLNAQNLDNHFISDYARDNPAREDIAESFLLYIAVKYKADRIPNSLNQTINDTIPNRIDYFDSQGFNVYPIN